MTKAVIANVALLAGACCSCGKAPPATKEVPITCVRGDLTASLSEDDRTVMNMANRDWLQDAFSCSVGGYNLVVPADSARDGLELRRSGESLVFRSDRAVLSLGDVPNLYVFLRDTDADGHFDAISYDTWRAKVHYVSVVDENLDGQPELRTTEAPDKTLIKEAWVSGAWQRVIVRDGLRLYDRPDSRLKKGTDGNFLIDVEPPR